MQQRGGARRKVLLLLYTLPTLCAALNTHTHTHTQTHTHSQCLGARAGAAAVTYATAEAAQAMESRGTAAVTTALQTHAHNDR